MSTLVILSLSVIFALALTDLVRAVKIGNFISDYALHQLKKTGIAIYFAYLLLPVASITFLVFANKSMSTLPTVIYIVSAIICMSAAKYLYRVKDRVFKWNKLSLKQYLTLINDVFYLRHNAPDGTRKRFGIRFYCLKKVETLHTYTYIIILFKTIQELLYTYPELKNDSEARRNAIWKTMLDEWIRLAEREALEETEMEEVNEMEKTEMEQI